MAGWEHCRGLSLLAVLLVPSDAQTDPFLVPVDAPCIPGSSFTGIRFDDAVLVRSNLGGLGGRCDDASLCVEPQTVSQANGLREVRIQDVGLADIDGRGEGYQTPIDLRIRNESEYKGAPRNSDRSRAASARQYT